jgi:hypothetical protein
MRIRTTRWLAGATAGVLTGVVALAVAQLAAGITGPQGAPLADRPARRRGRHHHLAAVAVAVGCPHRGLHTLSVRATDNSGRTQVSRRAPPFPDGASGWDSVVVTVS